MSAEESRPTETGRPTTTPLTVTSLAAALKLGGEPGPSRTLYLDPQLISREGSFYAMSLTAAQARQISMFLLDMAADADGDLP